jgi:hypothetical protein
MKQANYDTLVEANEELNNAIQGFNKVWFDELSIDKQNKLFIPLMDLIRAYKKVTILSQTVQPEAFLVSFGEETIQLK